MPSRMFTIKNTVTGNIYGQAKTLRDARTFCDNRLLRSGASREEFLSNLAAGIISVYDARHTAYQGPGF